MSLDNVLAVAGAALGLLFAQWSGRLLVALLSTDTQSVALDIRVNSTVMAYTAALAIWSAMPSGRVESGRPEST